MRAELALSAFLLAAAALPAAARPRVPRPYADALILKAFSAPGAGLRGRERLQFFPVGAEPRGMTALVEILPDGSLRREMPVGKRVKRPLVFVRAGWRAMLWWPKKNEFRSGPALEETPRAVLARLKSFYTLSVSTAGHVAKRRTWRVDMTAPGGVLRRSLWVDRKTGLLLKSEDYRADGSLLRRRRYLKLEFPADTAPADLRLEAPAGARLLTWTEPEKGAAAPEARLPRWLPDGFLLVSVARAEGAVAALYSDGAASFTVTEGAGRAPRAAGDLTPDELARVLSSLPEGR